MFPDAFSCTWACQPRYLRRARRARRPRRSTETPSPIPTTPSTNPHQTPDRIGAHTRLLSTTKKRRLLLPLTPLAFAPPARQPRPPHPAPQPPRLKPRLSFLYLRTTEP